MTAPRPDSEALAARAQELQPWLAQGARLGGLLIALSLIQAAVAARSALSAGANALPFLVALLLAAAATPPTLHLWRAHRALTPAGPGEESARIAESLRHQARFWSYADALSFAVAGTLTVALTLALTLMIGLWIRS